MANDNILLIIAIIAVIVSAIAFVLTAGIDKEADILFGPNQTAGNITVEIERKLEIEFTYNLINWSTGAVDQAGGNTNATLSSEGEISGNISFRNETQGFVLENRGNINATIDIKTNKNATDIGGVVVPPEFKFKVRTCNSAGTNCTYAASIGLTDDQGGGASCKNSTGGNQMLGGFNLSQYSDVVVPQTGDGIRVCDIFEWEDNRDEIRIDARVVIPRDSPVGDKSALMTATAQIA